MKTKPECKCALYWDESLIWGLMAETALRSAGLPFELVRSEDIRTGALERFRIVYVPGGWASQKIKALGEKGAAEIKAFLESGGSYMGICGGAGMATQDGIGLLGIARKPGPERVAGFNGSIRVEMAPHKIWEGIAKPVFTAAWPSQFCIRDIVDKEIIILARYGDAEPGSFSSDINVADGRVIGWPLLENLYGILLDPERLMGEPAVLEGSYGRGKVLLSLLHFDYPQDPNGAAVLRKIFEYLAPAPDPGPVEFTRQNEPRSAIGPGRENLNDQLAAINSAIDRIIAAGERNFLWLRRNALLLQWRRGVRGLEYSTLCAMMGRISGILGGPCCMLSDLPFINKSLDEIRDLLEPFTEKAIRLLLLERVYLNTRPLSPLSCDNDEISRMRGELFGTAMSHGGEFKHLVDAMDRLLYKLMKQENRES